MAEMSRDDLLRVVREVYEARDPVPTGLVQRMQVAAVTEQAGLAWDLALMLLVEGSGHPGDPGRRPGRHRRGDAGDYTLRFVLGDTELRVSIATVGDRGPVSLTGRVLPSRPMTVRLLRSGARSTAEVLDERGHVRLTGLRPGLVRLRLEPHDLGRPVLLTPTFEV